MTAILNLVLLLEIWLLSVSCSNLGHSGASASGETSEPDADCALPAFPDNGYYTVLDTPGAANPGDPVSSNTIIQFQCDSGYEASAYSTAICVNGNWDSEFKECKRKVTCPLPKTPSHGSYKLSGSDCHLVEGTEVPNWSIVTYSCNTAYDIVGNTAALCWNGVWSAEPPSCQKTPACVVPDPPASGSYSVVGSTEAPVPGAVIPEKEALRYRCPVKNACVNDQVIVCSQGEWLPGVVECIDYPSDCGDVLGDKSGVYLVKPSKETEPFEVYCDLTLAGNKWTVIQQRFSEDVNFYRNYTEYSEGFGKAAGNHWLGLQNIHELTKGEDCELYVDLEGNDGSKASARYSVFIVDSSKTGYKLAIEGYSGTAGDSMSSGGSSYNMNGMKFTTFDNDQDPTATRNNAVLYHGAGWYNTDVYSNLNGAYHNTATPNIETMHWYHMHTNRVALKSSRMLIKRKMAVASFMTIESETDGKAKWFK